MTVSNIETLKYLLKRQWKFSLDKGFTKSSKAYIFQEKIKRQKGTENDRQGQV